MLRKQPKRKSQRTNQENSSHKHKNERKEDSKAKVQKNTKSENKTDFTKQREINHTNRIKQPKLTKHL